VMDIEIDQCHARKAVHVQRMADTHRDIVEKQKPPAAAYSAW
jgi:hypothetical protein